MGKFFIGNMSTSQITIPELPIKRGSGRATATRWGDGEIACEVPFGAASGTTGLPFSPEFTVGQFFLGYIADEMTNRAIINMGPITHIESDFGTQTHRVRAGGIASYLDRRFNNTPGANFNTSGIPDSLSNFSLHDDDTDPGLKSWRSWMSYTVDALNDRSVGFGASSGAPTIGWITTGTPTPSTATFLAPYNPADFQTFTARFNQLSELSGVGWSVRPGFVGQTSTSIISVSVDDNSEVVWDIFDNNYVFNDEATEGGYGPIGLTEGEFPFSYIDNKMLIANGMTNLRISSDIQGVYTAVHAQEPASGDGTNLRVVGPEDAWPIIETRLNGDNKLFSSMVDYVLPLGRIVETYTFEVPRKGPVAPGWDLPGKTIYVNYPDHNTPLVVQSVTVRDGAPTFEIQATRNDPPPVGTAAGKMASWWAAENLARWQKARDQQVERLNARVTKGGL